MKIILSGYNLDIETLKELRQFVEQVYSQLSPEAFQKLGEEERNATLHRLYQQASELHLRDNLTPETLSAAYARISRSPKAVDELREIARREVDRARKSNRNIIFGLGHSSVAEHAVFNFDVLGVSRLAVEFIEHFRLASFTEKSQRYVLFQDEYHIPEEITHPELRREYQQVVQKLFAAYHHLYASLRPYVFEKFPQLAREKKNHSQLEGLAKEDARYITPLATQTQLGMTLNARSLEHMIARGLAHPLKEIQAFANALYQEAAHHAPSLIKYTEPTDYLRYKETDIQEALQSLPLPGAAFSEEEDVRLLEITPEADVQVLASVLFHFHHVPFSRALHTARQLTARQKQELFRSIFRHINPWDSVLREFENVTMTFELTISASCFGQLKRHRMATIIPQDYHPALGLTIPEAIEAVGLKDFFLEHVSLAESLYRKLAQEIPEAKNYILTNAHRRRVLFRLNLRELYHFLRLREDHHAQWDIRQIAEKMHGLVQKQIPFAGALLAGKDRFPETYRNFFRN